MAIYIFQIIWVFLCYPLAKMNFTLQKRKISGRAVYLFVVFSFLGIVMALRSPQIGSDTHTYAYMFRQIQSSSNFSIAIKKSDITAPVYVAYAYILGKIFPDPQILTAMNSVIITVGMAAFIFRDSKNVVFSSFLYIGLTLYYESMNGARQFMAVVLALNAILYLKKNLKSKIGWILFVLSVGIHNTAVFFMIAIAGILIAKKSKNLKQLCGMSIAYSTLFILAFYGLLTIFLKYFPYYDMYTNGENSASILNNSGGGRIIILYIAYLLVFVLYYMKERKNKDSFDSSDHLEIPAMIFCVVIGIVFSKNILMNRLLWYFSSLFILLIPKTYEKYKNTTKIIMYNITFVSLIIYSMIHLIEDKSGIVPYSVFWSVR